MNKIQKSNSKKSNSKKINRNTDHRKTKRRYGMIIEYNDNKQKDKIILNYVLNNPQSNLVVILPTISLSSDLRTDIYQYIKTFGTIKAVKKIKLDFDSVVKLINHFYIIQKKKVDIMEIKRKVMLDISWQMGEKKSLYVVIWHKHNKLSYNKIEGHIKEYLMKYELNNIISDDLTEYVSQNKNIKMSNRKQSYNLESKMNVLDVSSIQSGGGEGISHNSYPLNIEDKSDEEITLNFLTNVIVDKMYLCMTHDYYETILFTKLLLSKNIIKKL